MSGSTNNPGAPCIVWDDQCGFCNAIMRRIRPRFEPRGYTFVPLREWHAETSEKVEKADSSADEMLVVTPSGRIYGGADAALYLMRQLWWAWPLGQLGRLPPIVYAMRAGYRWIARNRQCLSGACRMKDTP